MTREASAVWPVRLLGDPRWLSTENRTDLFWLARSLRIDYQRADFLYGFVRSHKPSVSIETGVHFGKTSTALLAALQKNRSGRLVSIDLPKRDVWVNADGQRDHSRVRSDDETGKLVPDLLRGRWTLLLGDAKLLLPGVLQRFAPIDFFFHDSEHSYSQMTFEYEASWPHLRPGGFLGSDDTNRSSAWGEFLQRHVSELELESVQEGGQAVPRPKVIRGPSFIRIVRKRRIGTPA